MKVIKKLFAIVLACTFVMVGYSSPRTITYAEQLDIMDEISLQLERDKQSPIIYEATWEQYTFDKNLLPYLGQVRVESPYVYVIDLIARKNGNIHIDVVCKHPDHEGDCGYCAPCYPSNLYIDIPSSIAPLCEQGANGRSIMCGTLVYPNNTNVSDICTYEYTCYKEDPIYGIVSVQYYTEGTETYYTEGTETSGDLGTTYSCYPANVQSISDGSYINGPDIKDIPVIQLDFYVKEEYLTQDVIIGFTNSVVPAGMPTASPLAPEHRDVLIPFGSSEEVPMYTDKDTYIQELENKVTELENKITELESNPITSYKPGDINGDGIIDATDASSILCYYAYVMTGGDGNLNILDFVENEDEYMAANVTSTTTTVPMTTTTTTQTTVATTTAPSMDIGGSKSNYENGFSSNNTGGIRNQFDKKPMG
mgnify:CR=1 FL=1